MRSELPGFRRSTDYLCRLRRDIARDLHAGDRIPALTREFNQTVRDSSPHAFATTAHREMPDINAEVLDRDPRLRRVTNLVGAHFDEPLPLQRAAEAANLEPTYFSRYFHERTGVTFLSWLSWVRVQETIHLIEETHCTVTCAALKCGFSDVRSCQRAFIRHTGKTASEIKRLANQQTERSSGVLSVALPCLQWIGELADSCLPEIAEAAACLI